MCGDLQRLLKWLQAILYGSLHQTVVIQKTKLTLTRSLLHAVSTALAQDHMLGFDRILPTVGLRICASRQFVNCGRRRERPIRLDSAKKLTELLRALRQLISNLTLATAPAFHSMVAPPNNGRLSQARNDRYWAENRLSILSKLIDANDRY